MLSCGSFKLQNKNFAPFSHLSSFVDENELDVNGGVLRLMKQHMSILGEKFRQYFPDLENFQKFCRFVNNPFGTSIEDLPSLDNLLQEQCIDLVNDWKCEKRI